MDLSSLKATVRTFDDISTLLSASWDSGRILFRTPKAVVRPRNAEELAETILWCKQAGLPLAARGIGHSQHGQALIEGGIVLDMRGLNHIGAIEDNRLDVGSGAIWSNVVERLQPEGRLPPVLTNNLNSTVGGTISSGGIGTTSHFLGLQADHVEELEVVTGHGRIQKCSSNMNRKLFDATRCGLGQFSIITRARMRVSPMPERIHTYHFLYENLDEVLEDQLRLLSRQSIQFMRAWYIPAGCRAGANGKFRLSIGVICDSETEDIPGFLGSARPVRVESFTPLQWFCCEWRDRADKQTVSEGTYPVIEACIPINAAHRIQELFDRIPDSVLNASRAMFQPLTLQERTSPLFVGPGNCEQMIVVGFYPIVPLAALPRVLPLMEGLSAHMTAIGGKRCLTGWVRYGYEAWRAHFEDRWQQVLDWKEAYDPAGIFGGTFIRYRPD